MGIIGLTLEISQTWTNMTGFSGVGAIVNRFHEVDEEAPEEWPQEKMQELKRRQERLKADREAILSRNKGNKVKKDYYNKAKEKEIERQERELITRSNNRVEFEMFLEEYERNTQKMVEGQDVANAFMRMSPDTVKPTVHLVETGGLDFYDDEEFLGGAYHYEDDGVCLEKAEMNEAEKKELLKSSRALLRYALDE